MADRGSSMPQSLTVHQPPIDLAMPPAPPVQYTLVPSAQSKKIQFTIIPFVKRCVNLQYK